MSERCTLNYRAGPFADCFPAVPIQEAFVSRPEWPQRKAASMAHAHLSSVFAPTWLDHSRLVLAELDRALGAEAWRISPLIVYDVFSIRQP